MFLGSTPRDSDSGLGSGPEFADVTSSQVKHGLEQLSGLWNKTNSSSHPPLGAGYAASFGPIWFRDMCELNTYSEDINFYHTR